MEDKKILNEESIAKAAASHGLSAAKALPKELMEKVVGGETETYFAHCPRCGEWLLIDNFPGGWEIYCPNCNLLYDASYIGDW